LFNIGVFIFRMHKLLRFLLLFFTCLPIAHAATAPLTPTDCALLQERGVITAANPLPCDRLQRVRFLHWDMKGQKAEGQMLVLDVVAPQVEALFAALYLAKFPLYSALPLEQFAGDDVQSMNANNSSAFNGRAITGAKSWSKHAYGVAIDINPLQNPYISFTDDGGLNVLPAASAKSYLNRNELRPEKTHRAGLVNESVVSIFAQHGFMTWGGDWDAPIDYQHFEIGSRRYINELIQQPLEQARANFNQYAERYRACSANEQGSLGEVRARCVAKVRQ
jgi:hypothetical protein